MVKTYDNVYQKIQLLRQLELNHKLKFLDVSFKTNTKTLESDTQLFEKIKMVYNIKKGIIPTSLEQLKPFYIKLIRNICSGIVCSKTLKAGKLRDTVVYSLNIEFIEYHAQLLSFRDPDSSNYYEKAHIMLNLHSESIFKKRK